MPQQKKPPERRQRDKSRSGRHVGEQAEVVQLVQSSSTVEQPPPDLTWRDEVQAEWVELWSSPMAKALKPTDIPALRRLHRYRSMLADALERYEAEPETVGSMGQPVLSHWAAEVHRLEASIQKLEDKCGLSPMARLRLGITFEEGVSLAHRNAQLLEAFRSQQEG